MKRGITLVEVLVLFCIIAILTAILFGIATSTQTTYTVEWHSNGESQVWTGCTWVTTGGGSIQFRDKDGVVRTIAGQWTCLKENQTK